MGRDTAPDRRVGRDNVAVLARGGALNLFGSASQAVFASILLLIVGRGLGAGGAGAFLESVALFRMLATTATLGVSTGFVYMVARLKARERERDFGRMYASGFVPLAVLSSGAAVIVLLLADSLARTLGDARHADDIAAYLRIMAWFIPAASMLMATLGATRGHELMLPTVLLDKVLKLGLQAGLTLAAIQLGLGAHEIAVAWLLPILIALVLAIVWLRKLHLETSDHDGGRPSAFGKTFRQFWAFTLPRSFATIFQTAVLWLDVILVGSLISPEAAGIYAVSTRLLQFGLAAAMAVGQVSQPMISRLMARGERAETREVYELATSWQILLTWPQYIGIALFAVPLLSIFGPEFSEGSAVVVILALSAMFGSAAGPVDMVLLMAGKSMWSFWNTALYLAVNLALNIVLIPRMGIEGAAIAWAVARVVNNLVPLLQVAISLKLHPLGRRWSTAATLAVTVFAGLGLGFRYMAEETVVAAGAYGVVAVAILGLAVYLKRDTLELSVAGAALKARFSARHRGNVDPPTPSAPRIRSK